MLSRFTHSDLQLLNEPAEPISARGTDDRLARWEEEQLFEEDVRAVLTMLRPNRQEKLLGWSEYRTGGAGFRATISWDPEVAAEATLRAKRHSPADSHFVVPQMTDVLESILVGSVKGADEMVAKEEFEIYREVIRELHRRLDEMQRCYE